MLKYEHISRDNNDDTHFLYIESGGAYRFTTTYMYCEPDITYYYKSKWHRTDGPAYIDFDEHIIYFRINGAEYDSTKEYCEEAGMSDEDKFMWVLRFGDELPWTIEGFYGEDWQSMPIDNF